MIFNWTFLIISSILAFGSLICMVVNFVEYVKQNNSNGEHRFTYFIATVMFTLFAAIMADTIFK